MMFESSEGWQIGRAFMTSFRFCPLALHYLTLTKLCWPEANLATST